MIRLRDVWLTRGERVVLSGLTIDLPERRVGIIGANGSGKSSFARLLNGLLLPDRGDVRIGALDTRADGRAVRRKVGFLFQNPDNQIVYPTVGEDLAFGLRSHKIAKEEHAARIAEALAARGLSGMEDRLVHELSGGQRQLVALAGILILQPDVLVLDEPTALLDLANTRRLMRTLDAQAAQIVMATHDLSLLDHFERVLCFEDGAIAFDGAPDAARRYYVERNA
ncbi:energy-coupling factor ABC transporter ATP-binding protein [Aureimonas frigidaquae]|uniref:energy-coupling factor ABC transporter ATP-binding protein n=1 Tax=Aureimonas frigidaquae TaxID=424757 RepID=UPI0007857BE0|nr:ABC transporter ATP-binding protein [Aureimonas frigidaquae]